MCNPTFGEVQAALDRALEKLRCNEKEIISNDISERAITHKLAEYLQLEFPKYNVDCEYNRDFTRGEGYPKKIDVLDVKMSEITKMVIDSESTSSESVRSVTTYPDIIVHERKTNKNNLLVVEAKKCTNSVQASFDRTKLEAFTTHDLGNEFLFQYGVFLLFHIGEKWLLPSKVWVTNGKIARKEHMPTSNSCYSCLKSLNSFLDTSNEPL